MSKIDLASGESSLLELSRAPKIFEAKASEIDLAGVQTDFLRPFGSKRPQVERQIRPNGLFQLLVHERGADADGLNALDAAHAPPAAVNAVAGVVVIGVNRGRHGVVLAAALHR